MYSLKTSALALLFFLVGTNPAFAQFQKTALVIIDMQNYFINSNSSHEKWNNIKTARDTLNAQIKSIEYAKSKGIPIVFIEYEVGLGEDGTKDELKKEVGQYKDAVYFKKTTDGMFDNDNKYKSQILQYLDSKNIKNLLIEGSDGGECVKQSILGALDENFNVVAINEAIVEFHAYSDKDFVAPYYYDTSKIQGHLAGSFIQSFKIENAFMKLNFAPRIYCENPILNSLPMITGPHSALKQALGR